MSPEVSHVLYLCADPGIPIGGRKGASVHIHEFVRTLRATGREVTVVATRLEPGEQHSGEQTHLVPAPALPVVARSKVEDPGSARQAQREMRAVLYNAEITSYLEQQTPRLPIDLVYERYSLFSFAGVSFARRHGLPHVLEVNAPLVEEASNHRSLRSRDLAASLETYVFAHTDHAIAVSDALSGYIQNQVPQARISVVPNGVDLNRFTPSDQGQHAGSGGRDGNLTLGFVGAVRPWHGVNYLLDAFARLIQEEPGVTLRIIGDHRACEAELSHQCEELSITPNVQFTGAVDASAIPGLLSELDLVVAPYPAMDHFYFSPLKIFEYMAAGKAIVASAIGQIDGVLEHERTALLVPPGDSGALCATLLRAVRDAALRQRLGQAARLEAELKHSWSARIRAVADIMAEEMSHRTDSESTCRALEV